MPLRLIILAAGKGTRMKSSLPKVLHKVLGKEIIRYVLESSESVKSQKTYVVVGYGSDDVKSCIESYNYKVNFVDQDKQLGTGHAVSVASSSLKGYKGDVLILNGDLPAITVNTLKRFIKKHRLDKASVSFITAELQDPKGYGRIIRDTSGKVLEIVEHKDATNSQKKINEINSGAYLVNSKFLLEAIKRFSSKNKQNEYYLPDMISIAVRSGHKVSTYKVKNSFEVLGVNDRIELSNIEKHIKNISNINHMRSGVTIIDPTSSYISPGIKIGKDSIIYPNTYIYGSSAIGRNCSIGPSVYVEDSELGNDVSIKPFCYLTNCRVANQVSIGPFAHLRPETHIKSKAKIGNFVEIKKSVVGSGSKVPHLSYIGDATLGKNVNIGAGSITCNYDGINKHNTVIEDDVFIGSDSMLVAPIKIGKGATTAAGSTITKDVESDSLAIERNQQKEIKNWGRRKKQSK